jgi:hypothetical protein
VVVGVVVAAEVVGVVAEEVQEAAEAQGEAVAGVVVEAVEAEAVAAVGVAARRR